jgi:hypothetical protein
MFIYRVGSGGKPILRFRPQHVHIAPPKLGLDLECFPDLNLHSLLIHSDPNLDSFLIFHKVRSWPDFSGSYMILDTQRLDWPLSFRDKFFSRLNKLCTRVILFPRVGSEYATDHISSEIDIFEGSLSHLFPRGSL